MRVIRNYGIVQSTKIAAIVHTNRVGSPLLTNNIRFYAVVALALALGLGLRLGARARECTMYFHTAAACVRMITHLLFL